MTRWWQTLSERERRLVGLAGLLALAVILYLGLLRPLYALRDAEEAGWRSAMARLAEVEALAGEVTMLQRQGERMVAAGERRQAEPLQVLAARAARARGLSMSRLVPEGEGAVTVWIDQVETPSLYDWILDLQSDYGIAVSRASLTPLADGRGVRAQVTFSAGES